MSPETSSAGGREFAGWQVTDGLADQLLGALAAATTIGGDAQLLPDLRIAVALSNGFFNLAIGNGFA